MFYKGDRLDFLRRYNDHSVALVATSPPYNLGKAYEVKMTLAEWVEGQRLTINEAARVVHNRGSVCWQVGNWIKDGEVYPLDCILYPLFVAAGLHLRNRIVWHYEHGLHATHRLSGRHETIMWWTKGHDYTFNLDPIRVPQKYPGKKHFRGPNIGQLSGNPLGKNPGDVWIIPNVKHNHREKTIHPCQFPIELVERLVLALTKPGDLVLDPYCGVGTTVLAAEKNGRLGAGGDLDADDLYLPVARERYAQLQAGTLPIRAINTPVFQPKRKD